MTATYDRLGINFSYPENWNVEEDVDQMPRAVSAHSPNGGFWSVQVHPFSIQPSAILDEVLRAMKEEYNEVECFVITETVMDFEADGYALDFVCLDFVVSCRMISFQHGHATYLLMYQAETRDFDALDPVFQAMTFSLLSESKITGSVAS